MDDNINSIRHKRNQGHKEDFFKGAMWFGASMNYGQTLYGSFNLSPAIPVLLNTSVPSPGRGCSSAATRFKLCQERVPFVHFSGA